MTLDQVLPTYDRREVHRRTCRDAELALKAVREITPRHIPGFRLLFGIRSGFRSRRSGLSSLPLWETGLGAGFRVLGETEQKVVAGAIGQFWRWSGGEWVHFKTSDEYSNFAEPGFAKTAIAFWTEGKDLVTETRVLGTDPLSARKMARYWTLIRPGSGVIRRGWLRAADRRSRR